MWDCPLARHLLGFGSCCCFLTIRRVKLQGCKLSERRKVGATHIPLPWTIRLTSSSHAGGAEGVRERPRSGPGPRPRSPIARGNSGSEGAPGLEGACGAQTEATSQDGAGGFAARSQCLALPAGCPRCGGTTLTPCVGHRALQVLSARRHRGSRARALQALQVAPGTRAAAAPDPGGGQMCQEPSEHPEPSSGKPARSCSRRAQACTHFHL